MYKVYFTKTSDKELSKIAKTDAKQIIKHLQKLTLPFPQNFDIKKMAAKNFYRLRVGKLRVLFEADKIKKEIWIRKIDYRGGVYK